MDLLNLLKELSFGERFASVPLGCDLTRDLQIVSNNTYSPRTKHIAPRFFYLKELVGGLYESLDTKQGASGVTKGGGCLDIASVAQRCWTVSGTSRDRKA